MVCTVFKSNVLLVLYIVGNLQSLTESFSSVPEKVRGLIFASAQF